MRVNVDSSVFSDPRFKIMGRLLKSSWKETIAECLMVWLVCYERRTERLSTEEIDIAADHVGFAEAMVTVGLADNDGTAVIVHGVVKRIQFLLAQSVKGKKGGTKTQANRPKPDEGPELFDPPAEPEPEKEKPKKFVPPTVDEVRAYCHQRNNTIDAETFIAFYASKGWKVGNQAMKDWKAAVITFEKTARANAKSKETPRQAYENFRTKSR
jgi:hypothetical protein